MTRVLDLATDLEDLVGPIDAIDVEAAVDVTPAAGDDRPPLVRPLAGLTTPVWYL